MATDINVTRRRKLLAHLLEAGGEMPIAPLHDWAGLKLLAAHQAFSQLMEGLVEDGLVTWDGTIFRITDTGRAEAALAKSRSKKGKAAAAEAPVVEPEPEPTPAPAPAPEPAPAPPEPEDRGHDHGHSHGHSHDHGHVEREAPPPRPAAPSRPTPRTEPPKQTGLRATLIRLVKRLLKGR